MLLAAFAGLVTFVLPSKKLYVQASYIGQVVMLLLAFFWLMRCHVVSDFSLLTVVQHSHTDKPLLYKIAGTWGYHEGSFLLWTLLMACCGGIAFLRSVSLTPLYLFSCLNIGFISFLLLACDPFVPIADVPLQGNDLNPILQDPLLAIHPPCLYVGYVSTAVLFVMTLLEKPSVRLWRQWALISWTFLTIGLGLGSIWAYYELGWGGWWFWDPVENISLIPWLLLTALIHAFHEGYQKASKTIRALSYGVFMACMGGTFVVRSGWLTSVHTFAVDPERGVFLGLLLGSIFLPSFYLFRKRSDILPSQEEKADTWKILALRSGIGLCILGALIVAFGTLYPLVLEIFDRYITVGAPYFNATFVPIMLPLLALMALYPWLKAKAVFPRVCYSEALTAFILSGLMTVLICFYERSFGILAATILLFSGWLLISTLMYFIRGLAKKNFTLKKVSMEIAHMGLAVAVLGMVLSLTLETEKTFTMKAGESTSFVEDTLTLEEMLPHRASNYMAQTAILRLSSGEILKPEKRFYMAQGTIHNETALCVGLFDHLYVVLGDRYEDESWGFRLYHKPWINLIWYGVALMVLGGGLGFLRRRFVMGLFLLAALHSGIEAFESEGRLSHPHLEERAKTLGQQLLCPTCAGQVLNDSEVEEAVLLKSIIRQQLIKGYSDQQVRDWFVERYGNKILLSPPFVTETILLWGAPWIFAFLFLLYMGRRRIYSR